MTCRSRSSESCLRAVDRPACVVPSTLPSRRSSRSASASSKPSVVAATASSRTRPTDPSGASLTSRQMPGALPRPTRPRSWCSWDMPNRSASMITIMVALGTSTPTSMTVVATSTSSSPAANAVITSSFSPGGSRPCRIAEPQARQRAVAQHRGDLVAPPAAARAGRSPRRRRRPRPGRTCCRPRTPRTFVVVADLRAHHVGLVALARPPRAIRCQARSTQPGRSAAGTTVVPIGDRPCGSSDSVEVSRSPNTVIATVRGIGVAVITRTCGGLPSGCLVRSACRCSTPNRCCSSTTISPRLAKNTPSDSSAWVPTTIPACPDAMVSSACLRALAGSEPVSRVIAVASGGAPSSPPRPSGPSTSRSDRACWAASTSVGASITACRPESITCSIARSATTVLPEPTSPCSSRFIGWMVARSVAIVSPTAFWPAVSSNGRFGVEDVQQPAGDPRTRLGREVAGVRAAPGQHELHGHRLVVAQPLLRGVQVRLVARAVDVPQRGLQVDQPVPGQQHVGHRVGDLVEQVQRGPDAVLHQRLGDPLDQRIDRDHAARETTR